MVRIPLVDLKAQYLSLKSAIDHAVAAVIAEAAFVGTESNRFVKAFEREFAAFVGLGHCVACGNGTDALEILLRAAGVEPGDEVLVPAVSWIATSEAVSSCGATPVFVDVLGDEYTMDPSDAAAKVSSRTVAMIPVHLYGMPARMPALMKIASRHHLFVLEDCAQAHGATLGGKTVGTFGQAASFSFFPGKNLGAWGDAGAMLTGDAGLAARARMISQHGQSGGRHNHVIEGRNSRMDGIQAAVLSAKLPWLRQWNERRRTFAAEYRQGLRDAVEGMQSETEESVGVAHLFVIEVNERLRVVDALEARGVTTAVHYPTPLPLLSAYARYGWDAQDFPMASSMTRRILSIPLYPEITVAQRNAVVDAIRDAALAHEKTVE